MVRAPGARVGGEHLTPGGLHLFGMQAVEDLCIHKKGANLYRRLRAACEAHICAKLEALVGQTPDHGVFLSLVDRLLRVRCPSPRCFVASCAAMACCGCPCSFGVDQIVFHPRHAHCSPLELVE